MKRIALLAAVLAVAPFAAAHAADAPAAAPAPTTTSTTATVTTSATVTTQDVTLADGSKVTVASDMTAWTVDAVAGTKAPKADGEYKLADGTSLKIEGGKVTAGMPAAAAPAAAAPAAEAPAAK